VADALADLAWCPTTIVRTLGTGTPHGPAGVVNSLRLKIEHAQILKTSRCCACPERSMPGPAVEAAGSTDQVKILETVDHPRRSVAGKRVDKET
jgi:hypothetical protein